MCLAVQKTADRESAVTAGSGFFWVFFFYGLTFFSMGLAILLEIGRGSDSHLRNALRPLAAFGLLHGLHEWLEMFGALGNLPLQDAAPLAWPAVRLGLLAFSFLSLTAFGAAVLSQRSWWRRLSLLFPLVQAGIWGVGVLVLRGHYPAGEVLLSAGEAWTRYVLGVLSGLVASVGLVMQQRTFRRAGLVQFGRDSLWAAVGFGWYGLIGQLFVGRSPLPPSTVINDELFLALSGIPIQLVRAGAGLVAAVFVMRFLRAFEVEVQQQIEELRAARLEEAERREQLRGELLRRVVAAQEAERKRVARELHDDTGQALTAIGLGLRGVGRSIDADSSKAKGHLLELELLVEQALEELQRMIGDLRPSHLDDLGLPAALRWYAKEIEDRADLPVDVKVLGEPRSLDPPVSTALFRIAQEALINVLKHAAASRVEVTLFFAAKAVSLEVKDDGRGFDRRAVAGAGGTAWGLVGMEERATLLGGEMELESQPGEGTCVRVSIPYREEREGEHADETALGG